MDWKGVGAGIWNWRQDCRAREIAAEEAAGGLAGRVGGATVAMMGDVAGGGIVGMCRGKGSFA